MSFPNPNFIKDFVNKRLRSRASDQDELVDDMDLESQGGITIYTDSQQNLEGFEISTRNERAIEKNDRKSKMAETMFNTKTPLHNSSQGNSKYGTTEEGGHLYLESKINLNTLRRDSIKSSRTSKHHDHSWESADSSSSSSSDFEGARASHDHDTDDDSDVESEHCHDDSTVREERDNRNRKKALKKLAIATVLSFLFMCAEIVGGYFANSLAIMTDASHVLTDVSSFLVSIVALRVAAKPSSKSMTFGWHRAEIIGAITSVLAIWVVTGILVYMAVMRIVHDEYNVDGKTMLITASLALGFNILLCGVLHGPCTGSEHSHHGHSHGHSHGHNHSHEHGEESENVNVSAAIVHVMGDVLQSAGVLIASIVIYKEPKYKIADPICTFIFSLFVLVTTITILRSTIVVLMEGTPANINYEKVKERLLEIPGVIAVHDLRIWSLTLNQSVMSCHLAVDKSKRPGTILSKATRKMKSFYDFHSLTIQVETFSVVMNDCKKCEDKA